jgi:hypothetical protein
MAVGALPGQVNGRPHKIALDSVIEPVSPPLLTPPSPIYGILSSLTRLCKPFILLILTSIQSSSTLLLGSHSALRSVLGRPRYSASVLSAKLVQIIIAAKRDKQRQRSQWPPTTYRRFSPVRRRAREPRSWPCEMECRWRLRVHGHPPIYRRLCQPL